MLVTAQGQSSSKSLVPYKGNLFNATCDDGDGDGAESLVPPEEEEEDEVDEQVCGDGCEFSISPSPVAASTANGALHATTRRIKRAGQRIVSIGSLNERMNWQLLDLDGRMGWVLLALDRLSPASPRSKIYAQKLQKRSGFVWPSPTSKD